MDISELVNRDKIIEDFAKMICDLEIERNPFQTDIYLYIDEETKKGELYRFTNPGGNSWLNDDHITIYNDRPHYDSIFDIYNGDLNLIAETLKKDHEEFKKELATYYNDADPDYDPPFQDVEQYVKNNPDYMELIKQDFIDNLKMGTDFIALAENYIDYAEEEQRYRDNY